MAPPRRHVCESGLRWILNYRINSKFPHANDMEYSRSIRQLVNCDLHSEDSLRWTIVQSRFIDKHGWHKWFKTNGPAGFQ